MMFHVNEAWGMRSSGNFSVLRYPFCCEFKYVEDTATTEAGAIPSIYS